MSQSMKVHRKRQRCMNYNNGIYILLLCMLLRGWLIALRSWSCHWLLGLISTSRDVPIRIRLDIMEVKTSVVCNICWGVVVLHEKAFVFNSKINNCWFIGLCKLCLCYKLASYIQCGLWEVFWLPMPGLLSSIKCLTKHFCLFWHRLQRTVFLKFWCSRYQGNFAMMYS